MNEFMSTPYCMWSKRTKFALWVVKWLAVSLGYVCVAASEVRKVFRRK